MNTGYLDKYMKDHVKDSKDIKNSIKLNTSINQDSALNTKVKD